MDNWKELFKKHKLRYMILNVKKRVFVEHKAEPTEYDEDMSREDYDAGRLKAWNDFCDLLPDKDIRWAIYDFDFKTDDSPPMHKNTILFLKWNPE